MASIIDAVRDYLGTVKLSRSENTYLSYKTALENLLFKSLILDVLESTSPVSISVNNDDTIEKTSKIFSDVVIKLQNKYKVELK